MLFKLSNMLPNTRASITRRMHLAGKISLTGGGEKAFSFQLCTKARVNQGNPGFQNLVPGPFATK